MTEVLPALRVFVAAGLEWQGGRWIFCESFLEVDGVPVPGATTTLQVGAHRIVLSLS